MIKSRAESKDARHRDSLAAYVEGEWYVKSHKPTGIT